MLTFDRIGVFTAEVLQKMNLRQSGTIFHRRFTWKLLWPQQSMHQAARRMGTLFMHVLATKSLYYSRGKPTFSESCFPLRFGAILGPRILSPPPPPPHETLSLLHEYSGVGQDHASRCGLEHNFA